MRARTSLAILAVVSLSCRRSPGRAPIEVDQTRPASEWLKLEPVRLLRDYVRIDTRVNRGEIEGALFLQRLFDCAGISSEIVCPAPSRCNLLARLPGRRPEGALLLLNHIDVVDAYPQLWKEAAPFEGTIKSGFLYGRGAYDMKSLALAQALALIHLKTSGIVPQRDVLFLAEADEESEQKWGSRWLLEHRPEWFRGIACALNEGGTNETVLRSIRFWGIETLQTGYASGEFESSEERPLAELARRWAHVQSPIVVPDPQVVVSFDMLANHLVHPLTGPLRNLTRLRSHPDELAALPDRYGAFLQARIFWSHWYPYPAGQKGNFRTYVIVSTPPGMDPDQYLNPILEDARRSGIRCVHDFSSGPTHPSPYPTGVTELLKRVTEARHPGVPFGPVPGFGGVTTSLWFRKAGTPAYGYSSLVMNITDEARRHGNDERVFLRDYVDGVDLYREMLEEFAFYPPPADAQRPDPKLSATIPAS